VEFKYIKTSKFIWLGANYRINF